MRHILWISVLFSCNGIIFTDAKRENILTKLYPPRKASSNNMTIQESWQNLEKKMESISRGAIKMVLPLVFKNYDKANISTHCMRDVFHIMLGVRKLKPWAMRFVDSSSKIIDGLLVGTFTGFGSYDECIETEVKSTRLYEKGKILFRGRYCMIDVLPPLPPKEKFFSMDDVPEELRALSQRDTIIGDAAKYAHFLHMLKLRMGICVPSGCTIDDMNNVVDLVVKKVSIDAIVSRCEMKEKNHYTQGVVAVFACYACAILLMTFSTIIDLYAYYKGITFKNLSIRILLACSFFTNFRKFVNTKTSSETLSCLNGIRFLSMTWVILGHTYLNVNFQVFSGLAKAQDFAKDFAFQTIVNGTVVVDTFFVIGGLLVCYLTVKLVRIQGLPFKIWVFVIHRFWRILPAYAFVLMLPLMVNLCGSGPVWHESTNPFVEACYENWWTNLLFINNFYNADNMCISHSWYIASDVQLYIGSLIVLLPILKWPRVGIILAVIEILCCMVYSGLGTYILNYPPTMLLYRPDFEQLISYLADFYYRPFIHIGPYAMGLLAGYLLAVKPDLKIPPRIQVLGWCLAITFNMSVLYGVFEWNKGKQPSLFETMIYSSSYRTAWALGITWMIICCATGHGGVVNYILSWKAFVPLGRLTYTAYLLHPLVQVSLVGNIRNPMQPDHYIAVWIFFGNLFVTYAAAFWLSMLIESPFLAWEKMLFPSTIRKEENNSLVKDNKIFNGSLKSEKNCVVISAITPKNDEESGEIDNKCIIYSL